MRILTRTQYDAICDIVMEQKKRIEELEAELQKRKEQVKNLEEGIRKKNEALDYCNDKLFERTRQLMTIQRTACTTHLDFPATLKLHEDKII